MKKRIIYLSGPMTGLPNSNYPAFEKAAKHYREQGHTVYSPHEYMPEGKPTVEKLREAFADYCRFICCEADTIVLLRGYENSLGVSAELALAKNCQLEIIHHSD